MRFSNQLFVLTVIFFLFFMPVVLAENTHSVKSDLSSFANGFKALFNGDTNSFVDGIIDSVPTFGLFLVVFGLVYFIALTTIFRGGSSDVEKSRNHRFARIVGVGIALLGVVQQNVYNFLMSFGTLFIMLSFLVAVIFMFVLFLNSNNKEMHILHKGLWDEKKQNITAKKALTNLQREHRLDNEMFRREETTLHRAEQDIEEFSHFHRDEEHLIRELGDLIHRAAITLKHGESTSGSHTLDGIQHHIVEKLNALQAKITLEAKDRSIIGKVEAKLNHYLTSELSEDVKQEKVIEHFKAKHGDIDAAFESKLKLVINRDFHMISHEYKNLHKYVSRARHIINELKDDKLALFQKLKELLIHHDYVPAKIELTRLQKCVSVESSHLHELISLERNIEHGLELLHRLHERLHHEATHLVQE